MKKTILAFIALFAFLHAVSQTRVPFKIVISGTVYGYRFDPSVKLLNKETTELEGSVAGVTLVAWQGKNKISTVKSSGNGSFSMELPFEKDMRLEYSKENYVTGSFNLDLSDTPEEIKKTGLLFENVELSMNSFISDKTNDKRPFGKLTYNASSRALAFQEIVYEDRKRLFDDDKDKTPLNLMNKSIKKNLDNNNTAITEQAIQADTETETQKATTAKTGIALTTDQGTAVDGEQPMKKKISSLPQLNLENLTSSDLESRRAEIDKAWEQLEKDKLVAITPEDLALIQAREELLIAAEKELEDAKKYIALQQNEITAQRFKIALLAALLAVLAVSAFFIVRYARQKAQLNKELAAKNKKITESIHYALRIQQSVLLTESQVQQLLPQSFVFYRPLDIVSGDFYWVAEVNSKIILAVADCTGHGVPGAFMSLIGNTLMNYIVHEKGITDAARILDKLHEGIIYALRQAESDQNNQDGMDLSLCVFDRNERTLQFAGAMNPAYLVAGNEIRTLEPTLRPVGGIEHRRKKQAVSGFQSTTIALEKGTSVYLTTDGFMDQFGGPGQLKFNLPRFKALLLDIQHKAIPAQKIDFENAFDDWKGNGGQVDDVLVMGFTI